jgi:hypothetical protein
LSFAGTRGTSRPSLKLAQSHGHSLEASACGWRPPLTGTGAEGYTSFLADRRGGQSASGFLLLADDLDKVAGDLDEATGLRGICGDDISYLG